MPENEVPFFFLFLDREHVKISLYKRFKLKFSVWELIKLISSLWMINENWIERTGSGPG